MPIEQSLPLLSSLIISKSCLTRRADLSGFWSFTLSPANSCRQVQSSPSATALASPKAPTVGALPPAYPCSRVASAQCSNTDYSPASIRSLSLPTKTHRWRVQPQRHGSTPWPVLALRTSAGTICGTRGHPGTSGRLPVCRSSCSMVAGLRLRWFCSTRTWPVSI